MNKLMLWLLVLVLALSAVAAPAAARVTDDAQAPRVEAPRTQGATLRVGPTEYVGGQGLLWSGDLGVRGRRTITLQRHLNRPGDRWEAVHGFATRTRPDGTFSFRYPAPDMFDISFRVASGRLVTPAHAFDARSQDLFVWVTGADRDSVAAPGVARPGERFGVSVDTTPVVRGRERDNVSPVLAGRGLVLQRRQPDGGWRDLGRTTVDAAGMGYFTGLVMGDEPVVLRAVAGSWTRDGSAVGWFPSFPLYVEPDGRAPARPVGSPTAYPGPTRAGQVTASPQAWQRYGWGGVRFNYDWELGQSLTSAPSTGAAGAAGGGWSDWSDGTGRVAKHNGGLALVSGRNAERGEANHGTTRATLRERGQRYGRWELRMRSKTLGSGAGDYTMLAELVPAAASAEACPDDVVTIARIDTHSRRLEFGAAAGSREWRGAVVTDGMEGSAPAVAVEVARGHLTWFLDGRPIGTVRSPAAVSDRAMTLRLSLVGQGERLMNPTELHSDWQRSWTLDRGRQVTSGPALQAASRSGAC